MFYWSLFQLIITFALESRLILLRSQCDLNEYDDISAYHYGHLNENIVIRNYMITNCLALDWAHTAARYWWLTSTNPLPLRPISKRWIWIRNSCFALSNLRSSPMKNSSFSKFVHSTFFCNELISICKWQQFASECLTCTHMKWQDCAKRNSPVNMLKKYENGSKRKVNQI